MLRLARSSAILPIALACAVAGIVLWYWWVPLTSGGLSCGARVYMFWPGGHFPAGLGEQSPGTLADQNAQCRAAASPFWWAGTTALALAAVLGASELSRRRRS